jgi:hypothetical protein
MNFKSLMGFLEIGERKILLEIAEVVKIATKANAIVVTMHGQQGLDALSAGNQDLELLEKRADEITFRVKRDITNGAVNPTILDNLLECVDVADSLVDNFHYLAREITRMSRVLSGEGRVSPLDSAFATMLHLADKSFSTIQELLVESDINKIMEQRQQIEWLEEEGDEVKDNAFDELYLVAPGIPYINFTHYSEILHKVDDILDYCEDLADLIVAIVTAISK